jgi:hypothetical protein
MNTSGYNNFIEKLHSSGHEYLDGFSLEDFRGLSKAEVIEVRNILADRASRGDGVALDGLSKLLPRDRYLQFLEELIARQQVGRLFYAQLATSICGMRGDGNGWSQVIDCLEDGDIAAKRWVLGQIPSLPVPSDVLPRLMDAVKAIVQDERNKAVLILASGVMLEFSHVKPKTSMYIEFSKRLQSPDQRDRLQALAELRTLA